MWKRIHDLPSIIIFIFMQLCLDKLQLSGVNILDFALLFYPIINSNSLSFLALPMHSIQISDRSHNLTLI